MENRDIHTDRCRKYRETHKEEIKQMQNKYHTENKERVIFARRKYYIANQDTKLEKAKQYRENNKEKINKYREEHKDRQYQRFTCDICGGNYTHSHKSEHFRSKKHLNAVKNDG